MAWQPPPLDPNYKENEKYKNNVLTSRFVEYQASWKVLVHSIDGPQPRHHGRLFVKYELGQQTGQSTPVKINQNNSCPVQYGFTVNSRMAGKLGDATPPSVVLKVFRNTKENQPILLSRTEVPLPGNWNPGGKSYFMNAIPAHFSDSSFYKYIGQIQIEIAGQLTLVRVKQGNRDVYVWEHPSSQPLNINSLIDRNVTPYINTALTTYSTPTPTYTTYPQVINAVPPTIVSPTFTAPTVTAPIYTSYLSQPQLTTTLQPQLTTSVQVPTSISYFPQEQLQSQYTDLNYLQLTQPTLQSSVGLGTLGYNQYPTIIQ